MKIKFLIHGIDTGYPNGGMTLTTSAIGAIGGTVITRLPGGKRGTARFNKRVAEYESVMGVPVEIATSDEEFKEMCKDIDVLFALPFGNKVWPTFEETIGKLKCKKVAFLLGSAESKRAPNFTKSNIWSAYWSERPMIRDYMQSHKKTDKNKPYIIGCNIYDLKCPYSPEEITSRKDPRKVISTARFGSFKGSDRVLRVFDNLIKNPDYHLEAWGWTPNEAGMSFLTLIKTVEEMKEMWDSTGKKVAKGTYTADMLPSIMETARFAIDFTKGRGDGTIFQDGGLQYCQAEAIDWGVIPFCDSDFHKAGFEEIMLLTDRENIEMSNQIIESALSTWDPDKHALTIQKGRDYIKNYLSRDRFNHSMQEVIRMIA